MECGSDEAAQQLDLLHSPLLSQLRQAGRPQAAVVALSLLATLCEQRPEAAEDLRHQGALAAVAPFVLNGAFALGTGSACARSSRMCACMEAMGLQAAQLAAQLASAPGPP